MSSPAARHWLRQVRVWARNSFRSWFQKSLFRKFRSQESGSQKHLSLNLASRHQIRQRPPFASAQPQLQSPQPLLESHHWASWVAPVPPHPRWPPALLQSVVVGFLSQEPVCPPSCGDRDSLGYRSVIRPQLSAQPPTRISASEMRSGSSIHYLHSRLCSCCHGRLLPQPPSRAQSARAWRVRRAAPLYLPVSTEHLAVRWLQMA